MYVSSFNVLKRDSDDVSRKALDNEVVKRRGQRRPKITCGWQMEVKIKKFDLEKEEVVNRAKR